VIDSSASLTSSAPDSEALIEECWGVTVEEFLPSGMKPDKFKSTANALDPSTLGSIAVLSSFTQGQSRLAREILVEGVALRTEEDQGDDKDPVVRKQDVSVAIEIAYERSGLRPVKITKVKSEKAKGKEKMKAVKAAKKADGKGKKNPEEEEKPGEAA
jgi:hypothetical protein